MGVLWRTTGGPAGQNWGRLWGGIAGCPPRSTAYDCRVGTTSVVLAAADLGRSRELAELQSLRRGKGLAHRTSPRRELSSDLAVALGVRTDQRGVEAPVQGPWQVAREEIVAGLGKALATLEEPEQVGVLAAVTWNRVLVVDTAGEESDQDGPRLEELGIVDPAASWQLRRDRLMHYAECQSDSFKSLRDDRAIRLKSDLLILDVLRSLTWRKVPSTTDGAQALLAGGIRRTFLHVAKRTLPLDTETSEALSESLTATERYLGLEEPTDETVGELNELIDDVSNQYNDSRPRDILNSANTLGSAALNSALQAQTSQRRQEAFTVAGKAFGILSYAAMDLGDVEAAGRHLKAAQRAAKTANDDELLAWTLGTEALIRRFKEDFRGSLRPVEDALKLDIGGMNRARLLSQHVLASAEIGHEADVKGAIAEAKELYERDVKPALGLQSGIFVFPESKFEFYAGNGLAALGKRSASSAEEHSRLAVEMFQYGSFEQRSYTDELLARIHVAVALVLQGDVDEVFDVLSPVIESPAPQRTSWHLHWLRRLERLVNRNAEFNDSAFSRELSEKVQDFESQL